jgi:hypothetical protein
MLPTYLRNLEKAKKEKKSWYQYVFLGVARENETTRGRKREDLLAPRSRELTDGISQDLAPDYSDTQCPKRASRSNSIRVDRDGAINFTMLKNRVDGLARVGQVFGGLPNQEPK